MLAILSLCTCSDKIKDRIPAEFTSYRNPDSPTGDIFCDIVFSITLLVAMFMFFLYIEITSVKELLLKGNSL